MRLWVGLGSVLDDGVDVAELAELGPAGEEGQLDGDGGADKLGPQLFDQLAAGFERPACNRRPLWR